MRTPFSTAVGLRIEAARLAREMTQDDVAELLAGDQGQSTLSKWETGERVPSPQSLVALCRILDVSADYLLGMSNGMDPEWLSATEQAKRKRTAVQR